MSDGRLLTITEVRETTGLQSSALRYYEREGLITPAGRASGRRFYDETVIQRLAVVSLLQEVGFTINEISELFNRRGKRTRWRSLAEGKLGEIDDHIERVAAARQLLIAAMQCGCSSLETCDMVATRRGSHSRVTQTLTLRMGPPSS